MANAVNVSTNQATPPPNIERAAKMVTALVLLANVMEEARTLRGAVQAAVECESPATDRVAAGIAELLRAGEGMFPGRGEMLAAVEVFARDLGMVLELRFMQPGSTAVS